MATGFMQRPQSPKLAGTVGRPHVVGDSAKVERHRRRMCQTHEIKFSDLSHTNWRADTVKDLRVPQLAGGPSQPLASGTALFLPRSSSRNGVGSPS
jgi:hypothetical protein